MRILPQILLVSLVNISIFSQSSVQAQSIDYDGVLKAGESLVKGCYGGNRFNECKYLALIKAKLKTAALNGDEKADTTLSLIIVEESLTRVQQTK
jgi:hypothetical protein